MSDRFLTRAAAAGFALILAVTAAGMPRPSAAQSYSQTSRAFVPSSQALAMGDAGVAFPTVETVFFYNPAHLSQVGRRRPQITLLGLRGSLSDNVFDQIAFFEDDLQPAINDGLDTKSNAELRKLYAETLALGRRRTFVNGDILLPSVIAKVGAVGFGGGVFGHSTLRYRFNDAGAGVPHIDFSATADLIVVGSASVDVGVTGLALGVSAKMMQRWLTLKNKPLDAIGEQENVNFFHASAVGIDVGVLYDLDFLRLPGRLNVGAAAYDVAGSRLKYAYESSLVPNNGDDSALIAQEEKLANSLHAVEPSYRIGAAYVLPGRGLLENTGFTVDYLWYSNPRIQQEKLTHLHVGAQAQFGIAVLRAGLNAGYTTIGGGLHFGFISLDYAFFGVEQGRFPGQLPSWNHSAQVVFRL